MKIKPLALAITGLTAAVYMGMTLLAVTQNFGNVPANTDTSTAHGGMFVAGNVTPQVIATAGVFEVVTAYDTVAAEAGITVDTGANTLVTQFAGTYICGFTADVTGLQNTNISLALFLDGVITAVRQSDRITENGDIASLSGTGFRTGIAVGQSIDVRMTADVSSYSATVQDANFFCFRPLVLE